MSEKKEGWKERLTSKRVVVREYDLPCDFPMADGFTAVFLTDLHNKIPAGLLKQIDAICPDVILVGGDVIMGLKGRKTKRAAKTLSRLADRYLLFYADGNHEQRVREHPETYGKMGKLYEEDIRMTHVHRLINDDEETVIGGIPVRICGSTPNELFYKKTFRTRTGMVQELEEAFGSPQKNHYTILLAHNPRYTEDYLEWGADLTLCGHYHGGVMMFGKKVGLISPDFRLFSHYCGGKHTKNDKNVIISAGLGEHTVPVRIHNPRELTVIHVGRKDGK